MSFGFNPLANPAATNIDYTIADGFGVGISQTNNNGIKILAPQVHSVNNLTYGLPTNHNGFIDNSQIELGASEIISPNSSAVTDVYKNLDRNLNENTWRGFSNPDLYTSPGNYPRVENLADINGNLTSDYNFDFATVNPNTDILSGKYEVVEKYSNTSKTFFRL